MTLRGKEFRPRPGLSCAFLSQSGLSVVPAYYKDNYNIKCDLPVLPIYVITIDVKVSNNGYSFNDMDIIKLKVIPPFSITSISPDAIAPGSAVYITGTNFVPSADMSCTVGGEMGKLQEVKGTSDAICHSSIDTPPGESVSVQLYLNGVAHTHKEATLMVIDRPHIFHVYPLSGIAGSGGSESRLT
eukprot:11379140-Ditylum_brightwellii.AAC.1